MNRKAREVLTRYWGYSTFRPMQEEIIDSVLFGNDTLALLPTGGGKSICFQVPAMLMDGLCLVVTPLIALMKDQVEQLKKRGIQAEAIYSGMHSLEVERIYSHAAFGQLKFLYISPERLQTQRFIESIAKLRVSLIAVDESHCISQWGYDFRPPYLKIAEIRPYAQHAPVLALTATATPDVVEDIMDKLRFRGRQIFQTSYERKNLVYNVVHDADKMSALLRLFKQMPHGSGVVYVRNRRRTREMAEYLNNNGISSTFYHAGLDGNERDRRQLLWMRGQTKVMVATNAFGMGIDKPDVRLVVHMDLPDTLEAYFQEAGRAGRDGNDSAAWMLISTEDIKNLKSSFEATYPEIKTIRNVYQAIGNFLNIPVGSGTDRAYDFDLQQFSSTYGIPALVCFNVLQILEREGLVMLTDGFRKSSKVYILANREDLYRFQVEQPVFDPFIKTMLRNFPGILTDFVAISEEDLGRKCNLTVDQVVQTLTSLEKFGILAYQPRSEKPQLVWLSERIDERHLSLSNESYTSRKKAAAKRLQAVLDFVNNSEHCRSRQLLQYFGESNDKRCGRCDVCLRRNELEISDFEFSQISDSIKRLLQQRPYPLYELVSCFPGKREDKILKVIRYMLEIHMLAKDENEFLRLKLQQSIN
ncbi:MAG TPA: ATP-dependent DNA helicase RecQ [Bacteroidales bacterium]|nr:ATP-dependent DNA helicase RecQ [Bacteroidales bacterium]